MSHFTVVVMVDADESAVEAAVEKALAPYDEADKMFAEGSRWDWWAIGGRWDGEMLGLPKLGLTAECGLCKGTGTRPHWPASCTPEWIAEMNGCNGCHGTGRQKLDGFAHGDAYQTLERNSCRVADIAPGFAPHAFIAPDGKWYEQGRMGWFASVGPDENGTEPESEQGWAQKWGEARGAFATARAVLVDCHV